MKKKPNLLRAIGRRKDPLRNTKEQLTEAEQRYSEDAPLWQREWCSITARAVLKTLSGEGDSPEKTELLNRVLTLSARMFEKDEAQFGPVRQALIEGRYTPDDLRAALAKRPSFEWDPFVLRLFNMHQVPVEERGREAGMSPYLPSHTRTVFELAELIKEEDVIYDLGSGLGFVALLLAWLKGARCIGVEYETALHQRAVALHEHFGFQSVELLCADARDLDYQDGTFFYFYDPFRGSVLAAVLEKLEQLAEQKPITIAFLGSSSAEFDAVPWLRCEQVTEGKVRIYRPKPGSTD